jgi:hypothetical protein
MVELSMVAALGGLGFELRKLTDERFVGRWVWNICVTSEKQTATTASPVTSEGLKSDAKQRKEVNGTVTFTSRNSVELCSSSGPRAVKQTL